MTIYTDLPVGNTSLSEYAAYDPYLQTGKTTGKSRRADRRRGGSGGNHRARSLRASGSVVARATREGALNLAALGSASFAGPRSEGRRHSP